ncbi:MAG TPA: 5-oxoprolinase subunit PxpA [Actinospica sp.]|nr:5-oxoprolinase subunit PxpA [Actinospica sp.]
MTTIDLNCDLGEGFGAWTMGDDEALLTVVTSANVACGFHAGDPGIMRRVCDVAVENGVRIGAHIGYRDLVGFGRRRIEIAPNDLVNDVVYQIAALDGFARIAGGRVSYVKPHGALYNTIATEPVYARALAEAVLRYDPSLRVLGLAGSVGLHDIADTGVTTVAEAFADRAYTADGHLVPRGTQGAVIHDVHAVAARCAQLAKTGEIESIDGAKVPISAQTICVHGDTPGAAVIARHVRETLEAEGVTVESFVPSGGVAP